MRGFWTPIALRALAIFVVGLALVAGVRHLSAHAKSAASHHAEDAVRNAVQAALNAEAATAHAGIAVANAAEAARRADELARAAERMERVPALRGLASLVGSAAVEAADQPFVLDGREVGRLAGLQLRRAVANTPLEIRLVVKATPGAPLSPCDVTPVDGAKADLDGGFRCTKGDGLRRVGTVRFEPPGAERALYFAPAQAAEMSKGEPVELDASLDGAVHLDVRQDGAERVRLHASDSGAAIVVRDEQGKTVRILAGEKGVAVTVDSAKK